MPDWPALPAAGEAIRLPLSLPPMLLEASAVEPGARYYALYWTPGGDELVWSDGTTTATGNPWAWLELARHPLGRTLLRPYELGSSDNEAEHALLADTWEHTLDAMRMADARRFLATQPSGLTAALGDLDVEEQQALLDAAAERIREQAGAELADVAGVRARMAREAELVRELKAWLDDILGRLGQ